MSKDKADKITVQWLDAPEEHDYPAAASYLALQFDHDHATQLATQLRAAKPTQFKAKDVFRASRLSLLGVSNSHVEKVKKKVMCKMWLDTTSRPWRGRCSVLCNIRLIF